MLQVASRSYQNNSCELCGKPIRTHEGIREAILHCQDPAIRPRLVQTPVGPWENRDIAVLSRICSRRAAALSPGARARAAGALPPRPVAFKRGRSTTPTARKRDKAASADRVAAAVESATPTPSSSLASGALSGSQGAFSYVTGIAAGGAGLGALSGGAYAPAQHLPLSPVMSSLVSAPPLVSSSPGDGTGVDADDNVPVVDDAEEFQ